MTCGFGCTQLVDLVGAYERPAHMGRKAETELELVKLEEDHKRRYEVDPYGNMVLRPDARVLLVD